jgi:hypothetical protein
VWQWITAHKVDLLMPLVGVLLVIFVFWEVLK